MMNTETAPAFFLGSVLLEPNRWRRDQPPVISLADWLERSRAAGFAGIEIWEKHWHDAPAAERERLTGSGFRFILNSYASLAPDAAGTAARERATVAAHVLRAEGVKFNFSAGADALEREIDIARVWAASLPPGCRLLCECHADTVAETPAAAARIAAGLAADRTGFILHPFFTPEPARWIEALGSRATHWHVQARDAANIHRFVSLADRSDFVAACVADLRTRPWPATATIEFTRGIGELPEDPDTLLRLATLDRIFLSQLLCS